MIRFGIQEFIGKYSHEFRVVDYKRDKYMSRSFPFDSKNSEDKLKAQLMAGSYAEGLRDMEDIYMND